MVKLVVVVKHEELPFTLIVPGKLLRCEEGSAVRGDRRPLVAVQQMGGIGIKGVTTILIL